MKKLLLLMLMAVLAVALLSGCSGGAEPTNAESTNNAEVKGETFDGGNVSVLVPEGWMGFHGTDYFKEYEEGYDPNVINVVKGAESEFDIMTKPYLMISYYGPDTTFMSSRDFYTDAKDIEPMELGGYSWTGFTSESSGYPITVLETTDGTITIQVTIMMENGNEKISLDDADVQAIIASISLAK